MDDMLVVNAYSYGDSFVDYQFQPYHRIIFDKTDLDLLYFFNLEKNKNVGFFFKKFKKGKIK